MERAEDRVKEKVRRTRAATQKGARRKAPTSMQKALAVQRRPNLARRNSNVRSALEAQGRARAIQPLLARPRQVPPKVRWVVKKAKVARRPRCNMSRTARLERRWELRLEMARGEARGRERKEDSRGMVRVMVMVLALRRAVVVAVAGLGATGRPIRPTRPEKASKRTTSMKKTPKEGRNPIRHPTTITAPALPSLKARPTNRATRKKIHAHPVRARRLKETPLLRLRLRLRHQRLRLRRR